MGRFGQLSKAIATNKTVAHSEKLQPVTPNKLVCDTNNEKLELIEILVPYFENATSKARTNGNKPFPFTFAKRGTLDLQEDPKHESHQLVRQLGCVSEKV